MLHSKESTANAQTDNVLLDNDVADAYDFKETTLKRRIVTNEVSVGNDCANNNNTDCENAHRGTFPPLIASIYNDRTYYLHTDKSPNTSFYLGHDFELRCRHMLQSHGFHMEHRGRSGDAGIDLAGEWTMPLKPVRVIGQCKRVRRASRMSVAIVREWEGVVAGMNVGHLKNDKEVMMATGDEHDKPCIGLLLATANLSPAAVDRLLSSVQPMIFVWVHADAPLMLAFLMNESARKIVPDIATAVDPHASATAHFDQATEGMAAMNGRKRKTGMTAVRPARVDHVR